MSEDQKLCKTCEHWNSDPSTMPPEEGWGFCDLAEQYSLGETLAKAMTDKAPDEAKEFGIFATSPCFGCVQHVLKANPNETHGERSRRKMLEQFPGACIVDWRDD